jgi:hypothetical protein
MGFVCVTLWMVVIFVILKMKHIIYGFVLVVFVFLTN